MDSRIGREKLMHRLLPIIMWAAVFLLVVGTARAQSYKIVDIRVNGNVHSSEKMITNVAALRIGSDLTGTIVQQAVRNLYSKGIFRDIVIDVEQVTAGVVVSINVQEYPLLSKIEFEGNKKIKDKDLKELLRLAPGGYIADHLLMQARNKIEAEYMSKGYFLAKAEPELKYAPDSASADMIFKINEYSKVKVEKVTLIGTQRLKAKDLVKKMRNRKRGLLRSSDFKKEEYPQDKEKIIAYCNKMGFVDAFIVSDSFVIDTARNRMRIYIEVYEGPLYYFGETSFSGNEVYDDEMLARALKYQPGGVFNEEKYEESVGELYSAYQEKGYLHARIFDNRKTQDTIALALQLESPRLADAAANYHFHRL